MSLNLEKELKAYCSTCNKYRTFLPDTSQSARFNQSIYSCSGCKLEITLDYLRELESLRKEFIIERNANKKKT